MEGAAPTERRGLCCQQWCADHRRRRQWHVVAVRALPSRSPSRDLTNAQSAAYKATWTQPAIGATDLTGNAASNTMYTEADNDVDF